MTNCSHVVFTRDRNITQSVLEKRLNLEGLRRHDMDIDEENQTGGTSTLSSQENNSDACTTSDANTSDTSNEHGNRMGKGVCVWLTAWGCSRFLIFFSWEMLILTILNSS